MTKTLVLLLSLITLSVSHANLPKNCLGQYVGEIPSYSVIKNDVELTVNKQDVQVTITEKTVFYKSGNLILSGIY